MAFTDSIDSVKKKIEQLRSFLSITQRIANAHTVDFYTRHVWNTLIAVSPEHVLAAVNAADGHKSAPEGSVGASLIVTEKSMSVVNHRPIIDTTVKESSSYGFCNDSKKLVDVEALLRAAEAHSLTGLGVCVQRQTLIDTLKLMCGDNQGIISGENLQPDEFMNSKKAHEVPAMAEVVAGLARCCGVKQVIDVGSGKGYLCSFLSMQYDLQVFGIDCSSTNTHGAQERNRKLKRFSRAYQKHSQAKGKQEIPTKQMSSRKDAKEEVGIDLRPPQDQEEGDRKEVDVKPTNMTSCMAEVQCTFTPELYRDDFSVLEELSEGTSVSTNSDLENPFFTALALDIVERSSSRVPPGLLSSEERERRKRENLERKARNGKGKNDSNLYSPLTSYVTAETELRTLINELEKAVMVGLHTCGDLAPSTLRMFVAKYELQAVCSVGCCYHLLSEQFNDDSQDCESVDCGFPMSQYLQAKACFCGRNARMSACLALERVTVGGGLPMESLFYRAVLHVILQDHYDAHKSEKRVGNIYSKASSFVDYVRRALRKLELDESKLSDSLIQSYHDQYISRMNEMVAFNMLKLTLAPCIEGLILLDRLCYLQEQEYVSRSALVQLFDPVLSPRCYAVIGIK